MDGNGLFHRGVKNHQRAAGLLVVLLFCTNCIQPTGNLDTQNSSEVLALLKETARQYEQTVIMITHNPSIAHTADRVFKVSDGVLTDLGGCRE